MIERFTRGNDRALAGLLIATLFLIWAGNLFVSHRETAQNAITENQLGDGYRVFLDLKNSLLRESATRWRRPLLDKKDFAPFDTYFLLSPKRPLSKRESDFLLDWVRGGGNLVISFETEKAKERLQSVLDAAQIRANITEQPAFENGKTTNIFALKSSSFMSKGEGYEFYSLLGFRDGTCLADTASCLVREASVGKGHIVAIAGVPPFANGLIERVDNPKFAARLAVWSKHAAFDEYHQFLSEKTWSDLLLDPSFMVPVAGFLLMVLLYFTLGAADSEESTRPELALNTAPTSTHHALGRMITRRTFTTAPGQRDALEWHATRLARLFPDKKKQIEEMIDDRQATESGAQTCALALVRLHRELLKSKGEKL